MPCWLRPRPLNRTAGPGLDLPGRVAVRHVDGDMYASAPRARGTRGPARPDGGGRGGHADRVLVASLASYVAFYAGRYLLRHGLTAPG